MHATLIAGAVVASACGSGDATGPAAETTTGTLVVETRTTGEDLDPDGYDLRIGNERGRIEANQRLRLSGVPPGSFTVELGEVAPNCAAQGPNPRSVDVVADAEVETTFEVTCDFTLRNRIVVSSSRVAGGNLLLFAMNPDGSDLRRITRRADVRDVHPDVSPDGTRIVFERFRPDEEQGIYLVNADGSGEVQLAADAEEPAWSPDGTRVAFRRGDHIFAIDAGGSGLTQLTSGDSLGFRAPDWSPDGSTIVVPGYEQGSYNDQLDIYLMNADGTGLVRAIRHGPTSDDPVFSPDGSRILFVSDRERNHELYIANLDGSGLTRLTDHPSEDEWPAWSPDGSRVVFVRHRRELVLLDLETGALENLTDPDPGRDLHPSWGPP